MVSGNCGVIVVVVVVVDIDFTWRFSPGCSSGECRITLPYSNHAGAGDKLADSTPVCDIRHQNINNHRVNCGTHRDCGWFGNKNILNGGGGLLLLLLDVSWMISRLPCQYITSSAHAWASRVSLGQKCPILYEKCYDCCYCCCRHILLTIAWHTTYNCTTISMCWRSGWQARRFKTPHRDVRRRVCIIHHDCALNHMDSPSQRRCAEYVVDITIINILNVKHTAIGPVFPLLLLWTSFVESSWRQNIVVIQWWVENYPTIFKRCRSWWQARRFNISMRHTSYKHQ